jgi:hypothetical protein
LPQPVLQRTLSRHGNHLGTASCSSTAQSWRPLIRRLTLHRSPASTWTTQPYSPRVPEHAAGTTTAAASPSSISMSSSMARRSTVTGRPGPWPGVRELGGASSWYTSPIPVSYAMHKYSSCLRTLLYTFRSGTNVINHGVPEDLKEAMVEACKELVAKLERRCTSRPSRWLPYASDQASTPLSTAPGTSGTT